MCSVYVDENVMYIILCRGIHTVGHIEICACLHLSRQMYPFDLLQRCPTYGWSARGGRE